MRTAFDRFRRAEEGGRKIPWQLGVGAQPQKATMDACRVVGVDTGTP